MLLLLEAAVRGKDLARIREDSVERIVKKYGVRIVVRLPIRCVDVRSAASCTTRELIELDLKR